MFKDFVPGDHYTIVKNPNYWDTANAAHLDKIIFKPIAEAANRLTALKSGTVDTIDFVDANPDPDIKQRLEPPAPAAHAAGRRQARLQPDPQAVRRHQGPPGDRLRDRQEGPRRRVLPERRRAPSPTRDLIDKHAGL